MVRRKSRPSQSQDATKNVSQQKQKPRTKQVQLLKTGLVVQMRQTLYKEMRLLQTRTNLLIPKLPFSRLVREILMEEGVRQDMRIQSAALQALQEACEMYMVQFLEDSYYCSLHAKRKTLMIQDMQLCRRLRGRQDVVNH